MDIIETKRGLKEHLIKDRQENIDQGFYSQPVYVFADALSDFEATNKTEPLKGYSSDNRVFKYKSHLYTANETNRVATNPSSKREYAIYKLEGINESDLVHALGDRQHRLIKEELARLDAKGEVIGEDFFEKYANKKKQLAEA